MPEQPEQKESFLHVRAWAPIAVAVLIFGYFFATLLNHEKRLSNAETSVAALCANFSTYDERVNNKLDAIGKEQMEVYKRLLTRQGMQDAQGK